MGYIAQAVILTTFVYGALWSRRNTSPHALVVPFVWLAGVSIIYLKYGPVGQLSFYQNDQRFHWQVLEQYFIQDFNLTFDRLNFLRFPYTAPAFVVASLGVDSALALKFVSLVCAVSSLNLVDNALKNVHKRNLFILVWATAGPMVVFFSLLALRETMMVMCVTHLFLGKSDSRRAISLIALVLLRPHLAAAIVLGQIWGWAFSKLASRWHFMSVIATAAIPIYIGTLGFSVGNYIVNRMPLQLYSTLFLRDQVVQVFSAFAGIQFLTVAYQTVEFSTRSLLLVRLAFPEIILVPLGFSIACLFVTPQTTRLKLSILCSFVAFTSISSGTEFLSVRQSLPLMQVMGFATLISIDSISRRENNARTNSIKPAGPPQQVESASKS